MTTDLVSKAKDVLQDALILGKASLNEVSDLIVNEMKRIDSQGEWLCNISLEDSESSLRHNFANANSVSFSFGDEKQSYKARIIKLNSQQTQKVVSSPSTALTQESPVALEVQIDAIVGDFTEESLLEVPDDNLLSDGKLSFHDSMLEAKQVE